MEHSSWFKFHFPLYITLHITSSLFNFNFGYTKFEILRTSMLFYTSQGLFTGSRNLLFSLYFPPIITFPLWFSALTPLVNSLYFLSLGLKQELLVYISTCPNLAHSTKSLKYAPWFIHFFIYMYYRYLALTSEPVKMFLRDDWNPKLTIRCRKIRH